MSDENASRSVSIDDNRCPECGVGTVLLGSYDRETGRHDYYCTRCSFGG